MCPCRFPTACAPGRVIIGVIEWCLFLDLGDWQQPASHSSQKKRKTITLSTQVRCLTQFANIHPAGSRSFNSKSRQSGPQTIQLQFPGPSKPQYQYHWNYSDGTNTPTCSVRGTGHEDHLRRHQKTHVNVGRRIAFEVSCCCATQPQPEPSAGARAQPPRHLP